MIDAATDRALSDIDRVQLVLDPLALLSGEVAVANVEAAGINLDTAMVSTGKPLDLGAVRVEAVPAFLESAFLGLDMLAGFVERSKTGAITLSDVEMKVTAGKAKALPVRIDRLMLSKQDNGALALNGDVLVDGAAAAIAVSATRVNGRSTALTAALTGANLEPFLFGREAKMQIGIAAKADFSFEARRALAGVPSALALTIRSKGGNFYAEGIAQEITSAEIRASYEPERRTFDIRNSSLVFGKTRLPFTGTVIDLDRVEREAVGKGFGLDLVVNDASAAPEASGERPIPFAAKATGRYLSTSKRLEFDNMMVSTPAGSMIGSLGVSFSDRAPEVSFAAQATNLQTSAIKQLWPYWMAPKARRWVYDNLFGGTVSNASIEVFMPRDRAPPGIFRTPSRAWPRCCPRCWVTRAPGRCSTRPACAPTCARRLSTWSTRPRWPRCTGCCASSWARRWPGRWPAVPARARPTTCWRGASRSRCSGCSSACRRSGRRGCCSGPSAAMPGPSPAAGTSRPLPAAPAC